MKKIGVLFGIVFLCALSLVIVHAADANQACRANCSVTQRTMIAHCSSDLAACRATCSANYTSCVNDKTTIFRNCTASCEGNGACVRSCSNQFRADIRASCSLTNCMQGCSATRSTCLRDAKETSSSCSNLCRFASQNSSTTCENGTYRPGDTFARGCDSCMCVGNGETRCQQTPFCHLTDVSYSQSACTSSGGLYQGLCNGPYFDVVCTGRKYCLCDGNENWTCGATSACVHDFHVTVRQGTIDGWKDLLGRHLGDIGICAHVPALPRCGNGVCDQTIVSDSMPETSLSCPQDCSA